MEEQRLDSGVENRILSALAPADHASLVRHLKRTTFHNGQPVYEEGSRIAFASFPISAVFSKVVMLENGSSVELSAVGYEGLIGLEVCLGVHEAISTTVCQIPGDAYVIDAAHFRNVIAEAPSLRQIVQRFTIGLFKMVGQSTACNAMHPINQRCARWLLSAHDRARRDTFELTHEFLATMLGTGRPSVSVAAATLQEAGLIKYSRGLVTIVDRLGLERASCECYRVAAMILERVFS